MVCTEIAHVISSVAFLKTYSMRHADRPVDREKTEITVPLVLHKSEGRERGGKGEGAERGGR